MRFPTIQPSPFAMPTCLANALLQLVSNSLLYTREGNKIHISVRIRGDNMAITVADRGSGIPDDIQRDLFTPYFSHDPGGRPFSCWAWASPW